MRWKQSLTPISTVRGIDPRTRSKLVDHHITTAEELVGQIAASPASVAELLEIDEPEVQALARHAHAALDPETVRLLEQQVGREYGLGALPPEER